MMLKPIQLLDNLRNLVHANAFPFHSVWPSTRRSAVLILLFIGNKGELRVLLTKRSRSLRSFSGHVSFPGGKADDDVESFEQVARREAEEEIGLPRNPEILRRDFGMEIENITGEMPCYISRTLLSVKPMVCFLHNFPARQEDKYRPLNVTNFFGKLNPGETSSLFSVPLNDMVAHLQPTVKNYIPEYIERKEYVSKWGELRWVIQHYYYPVENENDSIWLRNLEDVSSEEEISGGARCRDLWGLTAKILTDVSIIANNIPSNELPKIHQRLGHEDLIYGLHKYGNQIMPGERSPWERRLINAEKNVKYSDVIPSFFWETLEPNTSTF